MASRWSELPMGLLEDVYKRLFPADHFEFGLVCSSWRLVGLANHRYIPRQFVGLVVPGNNSNGENWRLIEPVEGMYNNDNIATELRLPHGYHCRGSSLGWFVLMDESFDMQLFNPITGAKLQLPSGTIFSSSSTDTYGRPHVVDKAVCSSTSSKTIVLVIHGKVNISFSKPGDGTWTPILCHIIWSIHGPTLREYTDAIYYKEKLYAVYNWVAPGGVVTCDLADTRQPMLYDHAPPAPGELFFMTRYLVESDGELFQVRRKFTFDLDYCSSYSDDPEEYADEGGNDDDQIEENEPEGDNENEQEIEFTRDSRTIRFKVFKLIDDGRRTKEWKIVESIGDRAFFVGCSSSFSVSASDYPGFRSNSIYFTADSSQLCELPGPVRHDIGIFNLNDRRVSEIYAVYSIPRRPPPFWFIPVSRNSCNESRQARRNTREAS